MRVAKMPTYRGQREKDIEVSIISMYIKYARHQHLANRTHRDVLKTTLIFNKWVSRKLQTKFNDHLL